MSGSSSEGWHELISEWKTFQSEETACAKALRQEHEAVFQKLQGDQCGWRTANKEEGGMTQTRETAKAQEIKAL